MYAMVAAGMLQEGKDGEAAAVLEEMREAGLALDARGYASLLSVYARRGDVHTCTGLCAQMRAEGVAPSVETFNCLLNAYVRAKRLSEAQTLVEEMLASGALEPSAATFNTLMSGFKRAGDLGGLLGAWEGMLKADVRPSKYSWSMLIEALVRAGDPDGAQRVLDQALASGPPEYGPLLYGQLLRSLGAGGEAGRVRAAWEELRARGVPESTELFEAALAAAAEIPDLPFAERLWADLCRGGRPGPGPAPALRLRPVQPSGLAAATMRELYERTAGTVPAAFDDQLARLRLAPRRPPDVPAAALEADERAESLAAAVARGETPSAGAFEGAVEAACAAGRLHALHVLADALAACRPAPHLAAAPLAATMEGLRVRGAARRALALFGEVAGEGAGASPEAWNELLAARLAAGDPAAPRTLDEMAAAGVPLGPAAFAAMAKAAAAVGVEAVEAVREQMRRAGVEEPVAVFEARMKAHGLQSDSLGVLAVFDELRRSPHAPSPAAFCHALKALGMDGRPTEAEALFLEARGDAAAAGSAAMYRAALDALGRAGDLAGVRRVLDAYLASGCRADRRVYGHAFQWTFKQHDPASRRLQHDMLADMRSQGLDPSQLVDFWRDGRNNAALRALLAEEGHQYGGARRGAPPRRRRRSSSSSSRRGNGAPEPLP